MKGYLDKFRLCLVQKVKLTFNINCNDITSKDNVKLLEVNIDFDLIFNYREFEMSTND
jgi:hypothetical protein